MFNKGQLAGLMKQAQAMQDNLKRLKMSWLRWRLLVSPVPAWSR